ncbi:predicted protein [Arabidopsis lyrata subsp. lyrata]|uniref:Predicted protein n=1 Tax=Arabidopsis lyrata subsp. lyrata TaxID=81972 RepID=D7KVJ5_ARALL|nr:predicted protein [Arabidopsis lyrata subsp. lyrata]
MAPRATKAKDIEQTNVKHSAPRPSIYNASSICGLGMMDRGSDNQASQTIDILSI